MNTIFGIHPVLELLKHQPENVLEIFISKTLDSNNPKLKELLKEASHLDLIVQKVQANKLDAWANGANHQGVVAKVKIADSSIQLSEQQLLTLIEEKLENTESTSIQRPLLLILDGVQDPHNLGACMRSAEALGANAVVVPKHGSVKMTAVVSKVSAGAAAKLSLVTVNNLAQFLDKLKKLGVWIIGASHKAEQSLQSQDFTLPTALILGGEGEGLRRLTEESCDALVKIPMVGSISSLNVSVAAGICLYEVQRQRQAIVKR